MALRDDGSYPRMDKLLHEAPTRGVKGDDALPLGKVLTLGDESVAFAWLTEWIVRTCAFTEV